MECIPTLFPTAEEFANPIEYLSEQKIQRIGHIYGMIKLVPPEGFQPPFSINKKEFRFNVRVQKLSELSISNRSRLFFMKQLNNFHRIHKKRGSSTVKLSKPYIFCGESQKLYLYDLFIQVLKDVSGRASTKASNGTSSTRKRGRGSWSKSFSETSESLILPGIQDVSRDNGLWKRMSRMLHVGSNEAREVFDRYISAYYQFISSQVRSRGSTLFSPLLYEEKYPKSLLSENEASSSEDDESEDEDEEGCVICARSTAPTKIILCDSCDKPFHISCLSPPLHSVPKGDWICNNCIIGNGYYGFKEESHFYTLSEFQDRCNAREEDLTTDAITGNPLTIEQLEERFWNYVDDLDSTFTVKYGADINGSRPGEISGFPTINYLPENIGVSEKAQYTKYAQHPMNLVNLPNATGSLLPMFKRSISGMTVPWIYIGSTFSTFCWHLEDQYTLSANYQHEGAPKVWYSIPEYACEKFQQLMKNVAPDLFDKQPDLLHQLVTLLSPYDKRFKESKIKCFKAIQNPNEYIITFPKCYHAGFNSGYNFNEAVNFTLDSWIPYGIQAITDYQQTGKQCVFDMFELMLNILNSFLKGTPKFQESLVRTCYLELLNIINSKTKMIKQLSGILAKESILCTASSNITKVSLISPKKEEDDEEYLNGDHSVLDDENEDYDVFCSKCGTICFLAFVVHYRKANSRKRRKLNCYTPGKFNDLVDNKELEVLCLKDYIQLVEESTENDEAANDNNDPFINDELIYLRDTRDVENILREASKKIDHIRG